MNQSEVNQHEAFDWKLFTLLRPVGYGLLVLTLLDLAYLLIPPRFLNPDWEFQIVSNIVDRSAVPLMGFALVFIGRMYYRSKIERILLPLVSWLLLISGIVYFLLIPIQVNAAFRLQNQFHSQYISQLSQQREQVKAVKTQLNKLPEAKIIELAKQSGKDLKLADVPAFKEQRMTEIDSNAKTVEDQISVAQNSRLRILLKNSVKGVLGAAISGFFTVYLWRFTAWSRLKHKKA